MSSRLASYVNAKDSSRQTGSKQRLQPSSAKDVRAELYASVPPLSTKTQRSNFKPQTFQASEHQAQSQSQIQGKAFLRGPPPDPFEASELDDSTASLRDFRVDDVATVPNNDNGLENTRFAHGQHADQDATLDPNDLDVVDHDEEHHSISDHEYQNYDDTFDEEYDLMMGAQNSYPTTSTSGLERQEEQQERFKNDAFVKSQSSYAHASQAAPQANYRLSHQQDLNEEYRRSEQRRNLELQQSAATQKPKSPDLANGGNLAAPGSNSAQLPTRPIPLRNAQLRSIDVAEQSEDSRLDHDHEDLIRMNFDDLSSEQFDKDPRGTPEVLPRDMATKSLTERLNHVFSELTARDQECFFAGLTMEEWTQAGSWFNEKFAALTSKMQESRLARRKMALSYEKRVSERHQAIVEEQQELDKTLKKMKDSGGNVLKQGTPSKRKHSA